MLNVKTDDQHTAEAVFQLFLQCLFLIGIVSVAKDSGYFQSLCFILNNVDSAKSNHAAEIGGVLGRLYVILVNDTERGPVAATDGIHLMARQGTMEI